MKIQLILWATFLLGLTSCTQEIQQCILNNTQNDIFGEIKEIRTNCQENACMNWFINRSININQTPKEIEECFQNCGLNNSYLVKEYIDIVIIDGCIYNQDLTEKFQIIQEEDRPNLRNSKSEKKEQNFISKFISNLWGSTRKEDDQQIEQQQDSNKFYGSWGSWGSWDSEYYYYGEVTLNNKQILHKSNNGEIQKNTTQGFLLDGEGNFNSKIQYDIREDWYTYGSINNGKLSLLYDSYQQSPSDSKKLLLIDYFGKEGFYEGEVQHKTTYDIQEKNLMNEDQIKAKGLKVPEQLKKLDFGSDYEVSKINESWEWELSTDSDLTSIKYIPVFGSFI